MRRFFVLLIFFGIFCFGIINQAEAQQSFARCDACGYCDTSQTSQTYTQPDDYQNCQACLYPGRTGTETLEIDPATQRPPAPEKGKYWTIIGCINVSSFGGFSEQGASGNVVQILLNFMFSVVGGIAFLYILYGSFVILTSRAEPERLSYGKRLVVGAITGVIFSLVSLFIVNFLANQIFQIPSL